MGRLQKVAGLKGGVEAWQQVPANFDFLRSYSIRLSLSEVGGGDCKKDQTSSAIRLSRPSSLGS
ncbi:MAG: hypothetical protein CMM01_15860 [Rhodopirellula sp.]|nr:hypothetical protein [Rhodopirellula sp.]